MGLKNNMLRAFQKVFSWDISMFQNDAEGDEMKERQFKSSTYVSIPENQAKAYQKLCWGDEIIVSPPDSNGKVKYLVPIIYLT